MTGFEYMKSMDQLFDEIVSLGFHKDEDQIHDYLDQCEEEAVTPTTDGFRIYVVLSELYMSSEPES